LVSARFLSTLRWLISLTCTEITSYAYLYYFYYFQPITPTMTRRFMKSTSIRICAIISVFMMVMSSLPIGTQAWVGNQSAVDPCCTLDSAQMAVEKTSETSQPNEDDCCPSECDNCFLLCCGGMVSLTLESTILEGFQSGVNAPLGDEVTLSSHSPRAIYHPPQQ